MTYVTHVACLILKYEYPTLCLIPANIPNISAVSRSEFHWTNDCHFAEQAKKMNTNNMQETARYRYRIYQCKSRTFDNNITFIMMYFHDFWHKTS